MTNEDAIEKMKLVMKLLDKVNEMLDDLYLKHLEASKK